MLLGLRTATYHVPDLAQARDWYAKALGIQTYFESPDYVGFEVAGFELGISPEPAVAGKRGGSDVYWAVADIEAGLRHFLAAGATRTMAPLDVGEGIKIVVVLDPFGNRLGLIENPHFGK